MPLSTGCFKLVLILIYCLSFTGGWKSTGQELYEVSTNSVDPPRATSFCKRPPAFKRPRPLLGETALKFCDHLTPGSDLYVRSVCTGNY